MNFLYSKSKYKITGKKGRKKNMKNIEQEILLEIEKKT